MPERVRVHVSDGTREVTVEIRGGDDKALAQAGRAAARILKHLPEPTAPSRFGFSWALSSDTERNPDDTD